MHAYYGTKLPTLLVSMQMKTVRPRMRLHTLTSLVPRPFQYRKTTFDLSLTKSAIAPPWWIIFTTLSGLILIPPPSPLPTHTVHGKILCNKKKSGLTSGPTSDQMGGGTRFIVCKKTVHYIQRKNIDYILYDNTRTVINSNKSIITSTLILWCVSW